MSCCGCNQTPCTCIPACPETCPEVIDYSFENINLSGQGVLSGVSSSTVQFKGIRSVNANLVITNNAGMGTVDIELPSNVLQGSVTFANAAARALTTPDFDGQYGVQLDTGTPYISTGTNAGDWTTFPWIVLGETATASADNTTIDLTTGQSSFIWDYGGSQVIIDSGANLNVGGTFQSGNATFLGNVTASSGNIVLGGGFFSVTIEGTINIPAFSTLQLAGVTVPANSVLTTSSTAGDPSSQLINRFLSLNNVNAAYAVTGGSASTTMDITAMSDPDAIAVANFVLSLVTDLMAATLPAPP